jgi:two-component system, NarL family, response regulator LiaR
VLLVDDHAVVRQALRMMLGREPDIDVVGEAWNGRVAIDLARQLRPDVVLMDVCMPVLNGVQATRTIHAEHPGICVIGLSMYDYMGEAMRDAGAVDYVTKSTAPEELVLVMRACYARSQEELPPEAAA